VNVPIFKESAQRAKARATCCPILPRISLPTVGLYVENSSTIHCTIHWYCLNSAIQYVVLLDSPIQYIAIYVAIQSIVAHPASTIEIGHAAIWWYTSTLDTTVWAICRLSDLGLYVLGCPRGKDDWQTETKVISWGTDHKQNKTAKSEGVD
jgi:hypothetical protein